MATFKQSTSGNYMKVSLVDAISGAGLTGLPYTTLQPAGGGALAIAKPGGAAVAKTLASSDWVEMGKGRYWILLSSGEVDTLGNCTLLASYGSVDSDYDYDVVAHLESDTFAKVAAVTDVNTARDVVTAAITSSQVAVLAATATDVSNSQTTVLAGITSAASAILSGMSTDEATLMAAIADVGTDIDNTAVLSAIEAAKVAILAEVDTRLEHCPMNTR